VVSAIERWRSLLDAAVPLAALLLPLTSGSAHPSPRTPLAERTHSMTTPTSDEKLLKPGEVAALFRVGPKTVTRWAQSGRLPCVHTPGGQVRIPATAVQQLLAAEGGES
jgi:excisionase family DNA binding protein